MRRIRFLGALLLVVAVVVPASAAAAEGTVTIRKVDTTDYPDVRMSVLVGGEAPTLDNFVLRENGAIVRDLSVRPIGETASPVGVVLVIDTSGSMRQNGKMAAAQQAAHRFVDAMPANEQVAVVAFSDQPRVVANFTDDAGLLHGVIDGLAASGETALWDGVRIAAGLFRDQPALQANLIVLSDGADTVSTGTADEARSTVLGTGSVVFTVGLVGGRDFDEGGLRALADASEGAYAGTTDPAALSDMFSAIRSALQNQYEVSYVSTSSTPALSLTLAVRGSEATVNAAAGTLSQGRNAQPERVSAAPPLFSSTVTFWAVIVLVLLGATLLAAGVLLVAMREKSGLESALQPYLEDGTTEREDDDPHRSFVTAAVVQKAVDATARLANRQGLIDWVEAKLEQAHVPLRPAEAVFFNAALLVVFSLLGSVALGFLGLLGAVVVVGVGPAVVLANKAQRRQKKFTAQLPDMLQLLASSLRAGYSLLQALEAASQEVPDPMGWELRRVLVEARLGRPLEIALEECAERMCSPDFEWAVMAVRIQREVGGNLAELLETVGETMVARERLRRDVKALTAEGRISAIVLGAMPLLLGVVMYVMNPDYIGVLFEETIGKIMLGASVLVAMFGFWWMKKTIEIEV